MTTLIQTPLLIIGWSWVVYFLERSQDLPATTGAYIFVTLLLTAFTTIAIEFAVGITRSVTAYLERRRAVSTCRGCPNPTCPNRGKRHA